MGKKEKKLKNSITICLERAVHEESGHLIFNLSSETNLLCDLIISFLSLCSRGITRLGDL